MLKNAGNQTVDGPHWRPYLFSYYGSQWGPTTIWFFWILQNIFFCVQHKKETYTGLERHDGDLMMTIFILGWTSPLNAHFKFQPKFVFWLCELIMTQNTKKIKLKNHIDITFCSCQVI